MATAGESDWLAEISKRVRYGVDGAGPNRVLDGEFRTPAAQGGSRGRTERRWACQHGAGEDPEVHRRRIRPVLAPS